MPEFIVHRCKTCGITTHSAAANAPSQTKLRCGGEEGHEHTYEENEIERVEIPSPTVVITVKRRPDGAFDYKKEGYGEPLVTTVPPVFEKIEAQLECNRVPSRERKQIIDELNRCGVAVVSILLSELDFD